MNIQMSDYIDVKGKARQLGCNIPTGISILPRNFDSAAKATELIHESSASTIRLLWRKEGIQETRIEKESEKYPEILENAFEWIGPLIFISYATISHNPHLISIATGVISNYLTDWFKGITGQRRVRFSFAIEKKDGTYKRIDYDGPPDGLQNLPGIIEKVSVHE